VVGNPARVLISGMGGELGTLVAQRLETTDWVGSIVGLDIEPPRARLRRAEFHLIDPTDRVTTTALVRRAEATHVAHLGVYEPDARSSPAVAAERNQLGALHVLGAASERSSLKGIVVRSGLEVYGRQRGVPICPDESVLPRPSTAFGSQLLGIEQAAVAAGHEAEVPVTLLRLAPVVGAHVPSPLGRLLRLWAVPVSAMSDPPFSLCHPDDAADAIVAALRDGVHGPVNVAGAGALTPRQALRLGGRVPVPTLGPGWLLARIAGQAMGAPVPPHVVELLCHGRGADTALADALGYQLGFSTEAVVRHLFDWVSVRHISSLAAA